MRRRRGVKTSYLNEVVPGDRLNICLTPFTDLHAFGKEVILESTSLNDLSMYFYVRNYGSEQVLN